MTDDPQAHTEVLLRRALNPLLQDAEAVPESLVVGAVQRGRRRRRARRAGVALVPLVAAAAVVATVLSIGLSTSSSDAPPTDKTPMMAWQLGAGSPLSPRSNPTMVQVGDDVLVLGGSAAAPCPPNAFCAASEEDGLNDGAVYEPDRNVWRSITPAPIALGDFSATASGAAVYVLTQPWSGSGQKQQLWEYSLTGDRWSQLPAPPYRMDSLVAAGSERLFASVLAHSKTWRPDQSFDIASRTWSALPRDPLAPSRARNLLATESGDLVLIANDRQTRSGEVWAPWRTAQYDATTRTWKEVPTPGIVNSESNWWWVSDRVVNPSTQSTEAGAPTGGIFDPVSGTWRPVPAVPDRKVSTYPLLRAAGSERVFVQDRLLDVRSRTWTQAPAAPAGFPTQDRTALIVGDRMIVFGGAVFGDSLRGTLSNDTWILPLPATS